MQTLILKWKREIIIGIFLFVAIAAGLYTQYGRGCEYDSSIKPEGFESGNLAGSNSGSPDADRLRSLPYVSWNPIEEKDSSKNGVVSHIPEKCQNGLNLFDSSPIMEAHLMDMKGKTLHKWSCDLGTWGTANIDKEGNLYVVIDGRSLCKIDWDSGIIWNCESGFHHWVSLAQNGDIYSIVWGRLDITYMDRSIPVLNDYITILSRDGTIKKQLSIYKMFGDRIPETKLDTIYNVVYSGAPEVDPCNPGESCYDLFHTNTVEIIKRDHPGLCKKGDLLVSIRNLNLIAIIDPVSEKVLWSWGEGVLDRQHSPELTENGTIVVFDNGPTTRKYSRILEVEPGTNKIVFEYKSDPPESFFSDGGGTVQKLSNGNVLIAETEKGKAFEVTRSGKTVWEYYDPNRKEDKRGSIHRMMRLDPVISGSIKKRLADE